MIQVSENKRERRAYDLLKGALMALSITDRSKEALIRELDALYEGWYSLETKYGDSRIS